MNMEMPAMASLLHGLGSPSYHASRGGACELTAGTKGQARRRQVIVPSHRTALGAPDAVRFMSAKCLRTLESGSWMSALTPEADMLIVGRAGHSPRSEWR